LKNSFHNIFIADDIHRKAIELLKAGNNRILKNINLTNSDLIKYILLKDNGARYPSSLIIRSTRKISKEELEIFANKTNIRIIGTASSGFDNIDVKLAKSLKIKILNVPDGNYISAAEHTLSLILAISKNINNVNYKTLTERFKSSKYFNKELFDKTIGIIGVGRVGSHLARLCRALGMNILGNDIKKNLQKKYKWIQFCNLKNLLKYSDIVTIHTPLDESTSNLLDEEEFKFLKRNAILINCARGGIINERILIKYLKSNKIYFAGIDVFMDEPEINQNFLILKNVLITPHQAGKTIESKIRISMNLASRVLNELKRYSV